MSPLPPQSKSPHAPFFEEIAKQAAPEYQGLAELLVLFRENPHPSDLARALFRVKKLSAVLEEAQRQLIARGTLPRDLAAVTTTK
jgi:hypothetical protein